MITACERGRAQLDQETISSIFHALSQPLTTLHCSLELAAMKKLDSGSHASIRQALSEVEQIAALASHLRDLIETSIEPR